MVFLLLRNSQTDPEADEKCAVVHRMDEIVNEVGDIKTDIATITNQVKDSKKVTDQVKQWRAMSLGGPGVVGIAGISLASSIEWISRLFHSCNRPTGAPAVFSRARS
jgi:hypothetical protein